MCPTSFSGGLPYDQGHRRSGNGHVNPLLGGEPKVSNFCDMPPSRSGILLMSIRTTPLFAAAAMAFILNCSAALAQTPCNSQAGSPCPPTTATTTSDKNYDAFEAGAKANIAKGNFQAALTDIGYLFDMHKPETVGQLTFMRAEALLGTGEFTRADEAIEAAQNADKHLMQKVGQLHFYFIRGGIYDGLGQIYDAQGVYNQAVGLPRTAQMDEQERHDLTYSYYKLAVIACDTAAYDQGMDHINNFLHLAGDNGNAYFLRGKLNDGLKNYDQAIADYNKAASLKTSADFHLFRGIAYFEKTDNANAIKDLTISIVAHPDSEKSYMYRGAAYLAASDQYPEYVKLGFADFDKAQSLNNDDIQIYIFRSTFHLLFATRNPKVRMTEASLAAADSQNILRIAPSLPGATLYQELAKNQLEQIDKLLGRSMKSTK
jgi:tetratricopeptide (TPR) repeat protein